MVNFKASNPFGPKFKSWIQQNLICYAFNKHCVFYFILISIDLIIKFALGLLICWVDPESTKEKTQFYPSVTHNILEILILVYIKIEFINP